MSCRWIRGGAGGARHADARPSIRDLAPPAPRVRRGRKTQPVCAQSAWLSFLCTSSMKRTRGLARVDLGVARLAASACVLRNTCLVVARSLPFRTRPCGCTSAPFETAHGALFASMLPCARDCGPANATPDSRAAIAARRLSLLARLGVACAYGSVLGWGRVLFPPFWQLPAHCTCAMPSGATSNNVDH